MSNTHFTVSEMSNNPSLFEEFIKSEYDPTTVMQVIETNPNHVYIFASIVRRMSKSHTNYIPLSEALKIVLESAKKNLIVTTSPKLPPAFITPDVAELMMKYIKKQKDEKRTIDWDMVRRIPYTMLSVDFAKEMHAEKVTLMCEEHPFWKTPNGIEMLKDPSVVRPMSNKQRLFRAFSGSVRKTVRRATSMKSLTDATRSARNSGVVETVETAVPAVPAVPLTTTLTGIGAIAGKTTNGRNTTPTSS